MLTLPLLDVHRGGTTQSANRIIKKPRENVSRHRTSALSRIPESIATRTDGTYVYRSSSRRLACLTSNGTLSSGLPTEPSRVRIRSQVGDRLDVLLIGASAQVEEHVILQVGGLAEAAAADVTSERPQSVVHVHVALQVAWRRK